MLEISPHMRCFFGFRIKFPNKTLFLLGKLKGVLDEASQQIQRGSGLICLIEGEFNDKNQNKTFSNREEPNVSC